MKNTSSLENQQPENIINPLPSQKVVDSFEIENKENSIKHTFNEIDENKQLDQGTQNLQTKKKKRKKKRSRKKTKAPTNFTVNSNQTQIIDDKSSKNEETQDMTEHVSLSNIYDDQNGNENVKAFVRTSAISFVSEARTKDTESQNVNYNYESDKEKTNDIENDKNNKLGQNDKCDKIDEDEQEHAQIEDEEEVQDERVVINDANDGFEDADGGGDELMEMSQDVNHGKEDKILGTEDEELLKVENNDADDNDGDEEVKTEPLGESEDEDEKDEDEDGVEIVVNEDGNEDNKHGVENEVNEDVDDDDDDDDDDVPEHVGHKDDGEDNDDELQDMNIDESSVKVKFEEEGKVESDEEITQEDIGQKEVPVLDDLDGGEDEVEDVVDDEDDEEDENEGEDKVKSTNEYEKEGQTTTLLDHDGESLEKVGSDKEEGDAVELQENIEQNEVLNDNEDDGFEGLVEDDGNKEEKECEVPGQEDENFVKVESDEEEEKEDMDREENDEDEDEEPNDFDAKNDEENKISDIMKVGDNTDHEDERPVKVETDEGDQNEVENDEFQKEEAEKEEAENEEKVGPVGQNYKEVEGGVLYHDEASQSISEHVLQNDDETEEKDFEDDNTKEKVEEIGQDEMDEKDITENDEDNSQELGSEADDSIDKLSDRKHEMNEAIDDDNDDDSDDSDDSDDGMRSDGSMSSSSLKVDQRDHVGIIIEKETDSQDNTSNNDHSVQVDSSEFNHGTSQQMPLNDLDRSNHNCLSVLGGDNNIESSQAANERSDNGAPEKKKPSLETHDLCTDVSEELDDSNCITVSVVTWNLAESSPSEEEAAFIKKFRNTNEDGSDIVLIGGQVCQADNTRPVLFVLYCHDC